MIGSNRKLPKHTTFQPGGAVEHFDDLECARCGDLATHSFGEDFDLCDECAEDFGRWLNR